MDTEPSMADSTLTVVMDGVQQLAAMKISGCRLILARHFEFVVLLHRVTKKGTRWTTAFTLSFSDDGSQWSPYDNGNGKNMVRNKN